jgi:predicted amidophosphoribosyltransferase
MIDPKVIAATCWRDMNLRLTERGCIHVSNIVSKLEVATSKALIIAMKQNPKHLQKTKKAAMSRKQLNDSLALKPRELSSNIIARTIVPGESATTQT